MMNDLPNDVLEAVKYLRFLGVVVIPDNYTYLNHCTCFRPKEVTERLSGFKGLTWSQLPLDGFKIKNEMSFEERDARIKDQAIDYRRPFSSISVIYTYQKYAKPFIIRVVIPKKNKNDEHYDELLRIYNGLGDGRHAKLPGNTNLVTIASAQVDEISGKKIDIFYCVREQDVVLYANNVRKLLTDKRLFLFDVTKVEASLAGKEVWMLPELISGDYYLECNNDMSRYESMGNEKSEFEVEYYQENEDILSLASDDGKLPDLQYDVSFLKMDLYDRTYVNKGNGLFR